MVGIDGDWVCPSLEEAVSLSAEAEQRLSLCDVLGRTSIAVCDGFGTVFKFHRRSQPPYS